MIAEKDATTAVEFVVIFPFFVIIVFYVLQVILALYWWQTTEEAAQFGARLAVVWDPAVAQADCPASGALPTTNCLAGGNYLYGQSCASGACSNYGTLTCTGGSGGPCNSTAFTTICQRMQLIFAPIQCSGVTISYAYSGLGYAGGPPVPIVTVTVTGVPFAPVTVPFLPNIVSTVPAMSASLTGEDLSSSGGG